ncbi:trimeric intracellular cation channel family protein [Streptomyces rubiginosohelvolus]|uniref:trimeric intracellular cation channel family protein n=1 Tax=Streptomyces TaxID=1883 RepID=UPI001CD671DB|nr:trimeric intracellular cation channel family protein [Streptomyces sp. 7G]MCA1272536.1 trimeric intracellular cation channel family protein [Streptomyces sp. 7G]
MNALVQVASPDGAAVIGTAQQAADLVATFAFGVSGALLAVRKGYDFIGLSVLAFATAFGGGVIRDVIINKGVPVAFVDLQYVWVSLAAAVIIFVIDPPARLTNWPLNIADAVGLALFCVTGTLTAYRNGLAAVPSALLGILTAIGGGIIRDLLANRTPPVLRPDQDLYAIPAIIGAILSALLLHFDSYNTLTGGAAFLLALSIRLLALRFHWHTTVAVAKTLRRPRR